MTVRSILSKFFFHVSHSNNPVSSGKVLHRPPAKVIEGLVIDGIVDSCGSGNGNEDQGPKRQPLEW